MSLGTKPLLIVVPWKEAPDSAALECVNSCGLLSPLTVYSFLIYSCFSLNKISLLLLQSMWIVISPLWIRGPKPGNTQPRLWTPGTSSTESLVGLGQNLSLVCHWCPFWGEQTFVYIAPRKVHPTHINLKVRSRREKKRFNLDFLTRSSTLSSGSTRQRRSHVYHERGSSSCQVWLWHPHLAFSLHTESITNQPVL